MSQSQGNNWVPFFFESNQFFKTVDSPEVWEELCAAYPDLSDDELLAAKFATYNGTTDQSNRTVKKYGFRIECDGEDTLADFFERNGMQVPVRNS